MVFEQDALTSQSLVPPVPSPGLAHSSMSWQVRPSPSNPLSHAQSKPPSVSVQVAFSSQSCRALPSAAGSVHSSMLSQTVPSPP